MSNHLSQLRDHSHIGSAMCPEYHTKDWRGKSCWLNPRKGDSEVLLELKEGYL